MIEIKTEFLEIDYLAEVPVRGKLVKSNQFLKVTLLEKEYFLSTLPGFHQTTLPEVNFKIREFFHHNTLDFKNIDLTKPYFNLASPNESSKNPELLFHIENLLLGILKTTHPDLFSNSEVLINNLYRPHHSLNFYKDSRCLKIKITPDTHNTLGIVRLISELHSLNPDMLFRLDGNRQFELQDLIEFENQLVKNLTSSALLKIDYIEEPLKNFYESTLFQKNSQFQLAIDESFIFFSAKKNLTFPAVIKPSLVGLSPVIFWLRSHEDHRAIISSSFEHPTILEGLYFVAQERPFEFHGLENFIAKS